MSNRNIRAGKATVYASLKDNISKGLAKIRGKLKSFATSAASLGSKLLGGAFASATLFAAPVSAASALEETMNKFNVVFGKNSKEVKTWSDKFADDVGRSEEQVARFMSNSQDLLVPMGIDPKSATQMSKTLTGLSVDLASFNNMQDGDVMRDLHAALTGSGEVMKKYGVIVSQAAVNQELLNGGLDPKNASEAAKAQARLNIILRGTTAAQGDAVRSSGSWANVQKRLGAEWQNSMAKIGAAILPILSKAGVALANWIKRIGEFAAENQGFIQGIFYAIGAVAGIGAALLAVGGVIFTASSAVGAIGAVIGGIVSVASLLGTVLGVVGSALAFLVTPVGLVSAALIGGAYYWAFYTDSGKAAIEYITGGLTSLMGYVMKVFGGIYDAIAAGDWQTAGKIMWSAIKVAFYTGMQWIIDSWVNFKFGFFSLWDSVSGYAIKAWNNTINFISKGLLELVRMTNQVSEYLVGWKVVSINEDEAQAILDLQNQLENSAVDRRTGANASQRFQIAQKEKAAYAEYYNTQAAQKEMDDLIASARTKRQELANIQKDVKKDDEKKKKKADDLYKQTNLDGLGKQAALANSGKGGGSFSSRVLEAIGGQKNDYAKRTADMITKVEGHTRDLANAQRRNKGIVFTP